MAAPGLACHALGRGAIVFSPHQTRHGGACPGDSCGIPFSVPGGAGKSAARRPGRRAGWPDRRTPCIARGTSPAAPARSAVARRERRAWRPGLPRRVRHCVEDVRAEFRRPGRPVAGGRGARVHAWSKCPHPRCFAIWIQLYGYPHRSL